MEVSHHLPDSRKTKRSRPEDEDFEQDHPSSLQCPLAKRPRDDSGRGIEKHEHPLRASKSDQLFDLFTKRDAYWAIFDNIVARLPVGAIIALQRTCKSTAPLYRELVTTQWNIDTRLVTFVKDPLSFRMKMRECGALVYGHFLLDFFSRSCCNGKTLYVALQHGPHFESFTQHLRLEQGYTLDTALSSDSTHQLYRRLNTRIQLVTTHMIPLAYILSKSRTTAYLSFMAWNQAYSLTPQPNFLHNTSYSLKKANASAEAQIHLQKHGWKTQPVLWPEEEDGIRDRWLGRPDGRIYASREYTRRVGDHLTWKIPFPDLPAGRTYIPDSVTQYAEFRISLHHDHLMRVETSVPYYKIHAPQFRSSVLRHVYIGDIIMKHLSSRLDMLARSELLKLGRDERPALLMGGRFLKNAVWDHSGDRMDASQDHFTPPAWWTYYDDELPLWYDMIERKVKARQPLELIRVLPYH